MKKHIKYFIAIMLTCSFALFFFGHSKVNASSLGFSFFDVELKFSNIDNKYPFEIGKTLTVNNTEYVLIDVYEYDKNTDSYGNNYCSYQFTYAIKTPKRVLKNLDSSVVKRQNTKTVISKTITTGSSHGFEQSFSASVGVKAGIPVIANQSVALKACFEHSNVTNDSKSNTVTFEIDKNAPNGEYIIREEYLVDEFIIFNVTPNLERIQNWVWYIPWTWGAADTEKMVSYSDTKKVRVAYIKQNRDSVFRLHRLSNSVSPTC